MVIERFKPGSTSLIGERFKRGGRMLPEGVTYHASWVEPSGVRCFQIMEAANPDLVRNLGQPLGRSDRFRDRARAGLR